MKDKEILEKLNKSFKNVAPEANFMEVRRRIEKEEILKENKKPKFNLKRLFLPLTAGLALCALAIVLFLNTNVTPVVSPEVNIKGYVTLDINPGFELTVDEKDTVINIKQVNEDAVNLVDKETLLNRPVLDVTSEIMDLAVDKGYITKDANQDILVTVSKSLENDILKQSISDNLVSSLKEKDVTARVNTLVLDVSKDLISSADELGITVGKYSLINNDVAKASESITSVIKEATNNLTDLVLDVSYNASTKVSSELDKYKKLLEEELSLEDQKERLEEAYKHGKISFADFTKQIKDIELSLERIDEKSDKLKDFLEENGFDEDDTLDYLEDQIEKIFKNKTSNDVDETTLALTSDLANVDTSLARLKSDYKRGVISKEEYKLEEEKLEALEDYLEDKLEYYHKYGTSDKYYELVDLLDKKYQANLDYLDGKITEDELDLIEEDLELKENQDKFEGLKEDLNIDKYLNLQKELEDKFKNGLISKKEFEKRLDDIEDYFDELEDIIDSDDELDLDELNEFLEENTSDKVKEVVDKLKKASDDFKKGLISASEYAKEKMKFNNLKDYLDDNEDLADLEENFKDFEDDIKDYFDKLKDKDDDQEDKFDDTDDQDTDDDEDNRDKDDEEDYDDSSDDDDDDSDDDDEDDDRDEDEDDEEDDD